MSFRVSIAQQPLVWQDAAANRAHFAKVLAPLAGTTDLVVLPEMFTTGFTMKPEEQAEAADGPTRAWLHGAGRGARRRGRRQRGGQRARPLLQPLHARDARRPHVLVRQAAPVPHGRRAPSLQRRRATRSSSNGAAPGCARWCATTCASRCGAGAGPSSNTTWSSTRPTGRRRAASRGRTLLRARAIENQAYCIGVNRVGDDGNGHRACRRQRGARLHWASRCSSSTNSAQVITVPLDLRRPARLARQVSRASRRGCLYAE